MQTFETSATVEGEGQIRVSGVPFAPGTKVEVSISPQRRPAAEFAAAWQAVCQQLRATAAPLSDAEIDREIADFRSGR